MIPPTMRRALDLKPGDTLTARVEDGRLVLEKREHVLARVKARFAQVPPSLNLVEELVTERRAESRYEGAP